MCCALGERMVADVLGWPLALPPINTGGVTKLIAALPRYVGLTKVHPVLCIADTDRQCAVELRRRWLPRASNAFLLRLAVNEAESWLLADSEAFADFLGISVRAIPQAPDQLVDAKREVLNLARKSKKRGIRQEMVSPASPDRPGAGYNIHLRDFTENHWSVQRAGRFSPSLSRAVNRLAELQEA